MEMFTEMAIRYDGKDLSILDQRQLPHKEVWLPVNEPQDMTLAIKNLSVRGAPLIAIAACLNLALYRERGASLADTLSAAKLLREARPTAVNLATAIDRILAEDPDLSPKALMKIAATIMVTEAQSCTSIAQHGSTLVHEGDSILTHCNTGSLATVGVGTALGVIRLAWEQGKNIHVYVDETRPLLQGARLTAWELQKAQIPHTLICDNMAAELMRKGKIQRVIVGADRIAQNGDFANKIGTYSLAVQSQYHGIDFHCAAPSSTLDRNCPSAEGIPIEERKPEEVLMQWSPASTPVWNPAFDITPGKLVTSFILDSGIYTKEQIKDF